MSATLTASTTNGVDLSRLPPPTVVEPLSYPDIRAALVADLAARAPWFDATVESDPAVKLLEVYAYRELLLRQQFNDRARQVMTAFATGANLDHLAALVGVARLLVDAGDPAQGIAATYEADDPLRRRIILAPESFSVAGPEAAYVFHALSADATIADASATSPAPGQVLVSILSAVGDGVASAAQIEAVAAIVNADGIRPLTDQVTVASASIVPYTVSAQLTLFRGPDETVIIAAAQANLARYIAASRLLGRDVTRSALFAALHVEGVMRVALPQPAADVVIDPTQASHCVGTNVTVAGYGE